MSGKNPTRSEFLRIRSQPSEVADVRHAVRDISIEMGFNEEEVSQIALAVGESLANVIQHSYQGACDKPIDIRLEVDHQDSSAILRVVIRDFGKQVDPACIQGRPLEEVRPGGLGVHIIRTIMDETIYERADGGGMRLTMVKKVTPVTRKMNES